ncbi:hypothetical protein HYPSUDRAFT_603553 [Hypholoma sublateritium FD-334 SS-4]|uniref:G-protein coupled receptors family 1 profile domain-containing protein n=1 Tax=Hypholoma sublateritium (strain FD-334 SS-4) TaxID=945553 RepID=A0A0D2P376_HYPSF|nr:hypothetical protein HYPSUDRAFT_603553 [Hypholoma sublateritium FD-334 SS-4]
MSALGSSEFSSIHLSLSWLNAVLYMLEIILAAHYLSHFDTKRPLKALLFIMLLADTICMITIFASTWLLIIKGPQSYSFNESRWTVLLSTLTITTVSVIEELFLINRCRRLAQHTALTLFLFALVITHAIFNIYSGFYVVAFPQMSSTPVGFDTLPRRYGSKAAAIAASIAAAVDVLVPLTLSWRLYHITPAAVRAKRSWRDTLVNTISFGGVGGLMGVVLLVLFWVRPDVFYVLSLTMGRVYVTTLLVNLLVSRRATSPYAMPAGVPLRKLSFSAEMMMTFSMPRLAREKQLPPTPSEVEEV